jgi:predicted amidohydrolase
MKISVIQLNVSISPEENIQKITRLVEDAVRVDNPDLVILPEMSLCISGQTKILHDNAQEVDSSSLVQSLADLASRLKINLHIGSMVEKRGAHYYNTSLVFNRSGKLIGRYSKIHRFDVVLPDGTAIRESSIVDRGDSISVVDVEGVNLGLTICYDVRFPELYRKVADAGADIIAVPSAFAFQTGADHWEVLLRARAIETQCYIVAPGQNGVFEGGKYMNFGHSMIVDPWGLVIAQSSNREGHATACFDANYMATVRQRIPVREHRVLD